MNQSTLDLHDALIRLGQESEVLRSERDGLEKRVAVLVVESRAKSHRIEELLADKAKLEGLVKGKDAAFANMESAYNLSRDTREQLEKQLAVAKRAVKAADEQSVGYARDLAAVRKDRNAVKESVRTLRDENEKLHEDLSVANEKVTTLKGEVEILKDLNDRLAHKLDCQQARFEAIEHGATLHIKDLEALVGGQLAEIASLRDKLREATGRVESWVMVFDDEGFGAACACEEGDAA